uniref:Uncharacterized protein n=1 Tax=Aegilops tauschii TaxID=37682 RepID=M8AL96_AEGTA
MEEAHGSAKKARLELPDGHVKQEVGVHHAVGGGDDGGAIVAAEAGHVSRVELAVKIDMSVLQCPLCTLPFKPPVFQVRSSTTPGAVVAVDEPTFLAVPRMYMVPVAGDAASMEVPLNIRIDKISH